ncbi:hypothetical protein [Peribacillus asahii]|uniref:hypothetical protein n=1 Tax=Peribacillus asahii TaxID=228899 RepID=UPI00207A3DBB|nr:hypothetical protein [Peribacillus asahii]USK60795.1 hypothetical protein LIT37_05570 [Peribacillus asahii]
MSSQKNYLLLLIVFMLTLACTPSVYAMKWEDEDTPISFKIEMLPWEEVNKLIPNKTKFTIIDVETGQRFNVQRRAGSQHADVQPLTRKDTRIMKEIYHNQWSWKRRAIVIVIKDQVIAASMHGMPHGAGALDNGFSGHFCVHFSGSITHRLRNEDLAHKLMILKAAGKLDDYAATVSPSELIDMFAVAVNQGDSKILAQTVSNAHRMKYLNRIVKDITYLNLSKERREGQDELLLIDIPARVAMYTEDRGKIKDTIHFIIRRESVTDRWFIDQDALYQELASILG